MCFKQTSVFFLKFPVHIFIFFFYFFLQDNVFMHLTNYAINKHSEDFIRDDEAGSKRYVGKKKCFWVSELSMISIIFFQCLLTLELK